MRFGQMEMHSPTRSDFKTERVDRLSQKLVYVQHIEENVEDIHTYYRFKILYLGKLRNIFKVSLLVINKANIQTIFCLLIHGLYSFLYYAHSSVVFIVSKDSLSPIALVLPDHGQ